MNKVKLIAAFLILFLIFSACSNQNTVTDIDGNIYQTIKIGDQTWMVENLKTTRFNNGDKIPNVANKIAWKQTQRCACSYYDNNPKISQKYGLLYNYHSIQDSRKIAPQGWRIPTYEDLKTLENFLNDNLNTATHLKEAGDSSWLTGIENNSKSTGFNALPGGFRDEEGNFYMLKSNGYYWTNYGSFETYHWSPRLFQAFADVRRDEVFKNYGFSVRCIKE